MEAGWWGEGVLARWDVRGGGRGAKERMGRKGRWAGRGKRAEKGGRGKTAVWGGTGRKDGIRSLTGRRSAHFEMSK